MLDEAKARVWSLDNAEGDLLEIKVGLLISGVHAMRPDTRKPNFVVILRE